VEKILQDLAQEALSAARDAGADYADVRFLRMKRQNLQTEDQRVAGIKDSEELGFGVRAIAQGAWGFAGSGIVTKQEVQKVARQAVAIAKASATVMKKPVRLVPEPKRVAVFKTPYEIDPFTVGIDRKVGLLLEINREILKNPGVKKAEGFMIFKKDERRVRPHRGSGAAPGPPASGRAPRVRVPHQAAQRGQAARQLEHHLRRRSQRRLHLRVW
jgi:TldD protein